MRSNENNELWQKSIYELSKNRYSISFLTELFTQLGYFNFSFATGAIIYKNTALNDLAKWLERELDIVDTSIINNIKNEYYNRFSKVTENNLMEKTDEY